MAVRDLTEQEQRRETLTETFASLALEGMYPTNDDLAYARAYISGETTLEDIIQETVERYRAR